MSTQKTLKEALYENLIALLSNDTSTRRNAEEQLKVFEVTNGENPFYHFHKAIKFNSHFKIVIIPIIIILLAYIV